MEPSVWSQYAQRPETRREHFAELQLRLNLTPLSAADYQRFIHAIVDLAKQTDRGVVLAEALIKLLRQQRIILPSMDVIERMCSEALSSLLKLQPIKTEFEQLSEVICEIYQSEYRE